MNEKCKKILIAISGFLGGIITFLFGRLLRDNRRGTDNIRDNISRAEESNNDARDTVESARQSASKIKQSNNECQSIINDVRKRGKKTKS